MATAATLAGRRFRHFCIVPGCGNEGHHCLGLRLRRPDTSAIWAPWTGAYLCDEHAVAGGTVEVVFKPAVGRAKGRLKVITTAETKAGESMPSVKQLDIGGS